MISVDKPDHNFDLNPEFLRWLAENGVDLSKCESKILEFGRGLAATKDIAENEIIVAIPEKLLLTPDIVLQDPAHPLFVYKENFTRVEMLILLLLYEKSKSRRQPNQEGSFWHYYMESLPTEYGIPSYWTEEDFSSLRLDCTEKYAESRKEHQYVHDLFLKVTRCSDVLVHLVFEGPNDDERWNELRWAHGTVWTRSCTYENGTRKGNGCTESCLVPFADLLNHHPDFFGDGMTCGLGVAIPCDADKNNKSSAEKKKESSKSPAANYPSEPDADKSSAEKKESSKSPAANYPSEPDRKRTKVEHLPTTHYIFRAARKIAQNTECFICYGQKTNWELLLNYGFALPNDSNPCDLVALQADKVLKICELWKMLEKHPERETMYAYGQLQNDNWYIRSNKSISEEYESSISYSMEVVFRTLLSSTLSFHDIFTEAQMDNEAAEEAVEEKIAEALKAVGSQMNAGCQAASMTNPDIASVIRSEYRQIERVIAHLCERKNR